MRGELTTRVIGVGQSLAGDDAVALEIVRGLRAVAPPIEADLRETADPSLLVEWLRDVERVVIVDAVLDGGPPGRLVELDADELGTTPARLFSTHGVSIREALGLARALHAQATASRIIVIGVTIGEHRTGPELSPPVAAAVASAIAAVRRVVDEEASLSRGRR